jgi:hypothetical protein
MQELQPFRRLVDGAECRGTGPDDFFGFNSLAG